MAKFILTNTVVVGRPTPRPIYAGSIIDSIVERIADIQSAGGKLVSIPNPVIEAQAVIARKRRVTGGDARELDALMGAAVSLEALGSEAPASTRTLYANNGATILTPDGSLHFPFPTITDALTAAVALTPALGAPVAIIVASGTYNATISIPSFVTVRSSDGVGQTRITPTLAIDAVVTVAGNGAIVGFRVQGANDVGGRGIVGTADLALMEGCLVVDCTRAYVADGASGIKVPCVNCIAARPNGSLVMEEAFVAVNGSQLHTFICRAVGTSADPIGSGYFATGAGSLVLCHAGIALDCTNGLHADDSGTVHGFAPRLDCVNGRRVGPGADATVRSTASIGTSSGFGILADGTGASIETLMEEVEFGNISIIEGDTRLTGITHEDQTDQDDEGLRLFSETSVGAPYQSRPLHVGEGAPSAFEIQVFQFDDSAASGSKLTSVTAAARSRVSSTFGFPAATQTTDAILFGTPRQYWGLVMNIVTAMSSDGVLTWEYWDGAAWVELPPGGTRGSGVFAHGPLRLGAVSRMNQPWEMVEIEHMHFNEEIEGAWTSDTGTLDQTPTTAVAQFWVRVRPSTLPSTLPILQQSKALYTTTVSTPRGLILHGKSRVQTTFNSSLNTLSGAFGTFSPGNQDFSYGPNVNVGYDENVYANGALDRSGFAFVTPFGFDMSSPITLEIEWMASTTNTGDVEWVLSYGTLTRTSFMAVADGGGTADDFTETDIQAAGGTVGVGQISTFSVRLPQANVDNDDTIFFQISRDATGGNPNDTFTGAVRVRRISVNGRVWRIGKP